MSVGSGTILPKGLIIGVTLVISDKEVMKILSYPRAASCPGPGKPCGWDYYNSPEPNVHVLKGALVGGPDRNDNYNDDRTNFVVCRHY